MEQNDWIAKHVLAEEEDYDKFGYLKVKKSNTKCYMCGKKSKLSLITRQRKFSLCKACFKKIKNILKK